MITGNYPSLCQSCVYRRNGDVIMLSTYCIPECHCDGCHKVGTLALTVTRAQYSANQIKIDQARQERKDGLTCFE